MKCKCNQHLPPKRNQRFDLSFKKIDLSEWKNGSFQNSDMTSERQSTRMKGSDFFVCVNNSMRTTGQNLLLYIDNIFSLNHQLVASLVVQGAF